MPFKRTREDENESDSEVEEQGRKPPRSDEWDPRIRRPREDDEVEEQGKRPPREDEAERTPILRGRREDDDAEVEEQGRRFPREDERERMPRLTGRRNDEDSEVEEQMPRLRGGHDEDGEADPEVDEQRWTHR